jgi:hypothetical protein
MVMTDRTKSDVFIIVVVAISLLAVMAATLALRPRENGSSVPGATKSFDEQIHNDGARMLEERDESGRRRDHANQLRVLATEASLELIEGGESRNDRRSRRSDHHPT